MIKVRIDKASNKDYWYNSQIGAELFVEIENEKQYVVFVYENQFGGGNYIVKSDCTVISDDTEQEEKEFKEEEPKWQIAEVCKKPFEQIIADHPIMAMPGMPQPDPVLIAKVGEFFHVEQFQCLMRSSPLEPGDTLSHGLMNELYESGLAIRDKKSCWVPSDLAYQVYKNLIKSHLKVNDFIDKLPVPVVQETTEDNYALSVDEQHLGHEEKINNIEVAIALAGFKFTRKDLDMLVSLHDLVVEYGGKLDLDTITETQVKVNRRHDSAV